ncbi:hypothetical protein POPTR_003G015433v4 [Populus trichocarpa]|uniref:Uncharacterized protein n=1 Tax=Populus trichocarpa TaxID=3694 RepID=A0ACC0T6Q7_POPTR|nr:hypothetical protein POPTR_003G015433v4 [Populus trichocarpa]
MKSYLKSNRYHTAKHIDPTSLYVLFSSFFVSSYDNAYHNLVLKVKFRKPQAQFISIFPGCFCQGRDLFVGVGRSEWNSG